MDKKINDIVYSDKMMKLYYYLGAEWFQKVVFKVEDIKYKIIDKFFPNISNLYEKLCNKRYLNIINKNTKIDKDALLNKFQKEKLEFRKELANRKNRNYHYNPNYPTKFVGYLELNKKIHQRGIIKNVLIITSVVVLSIIFENSIPIISYSIISFELLSAFINFECINLQNYNLCRFKNEKMQNFLKKSEEHRLNANLKKLNDGIKPVSKSIKNQIELPTIDQVIDNVKTNNQKIQLLEYAKEQLLNMKKDEINKQKQIGGK